MREICFSERLKHVLLFRIHFALNCGARSCPPIRVYDAAKLDRQLDTAAKSFVSQEAEVAEGGVAKVSKIFMWYKGDFGEDDEEFKTTVGKFIVDEDKVIGEIDILSRPVSFYS